jgi:hypothetical protein
MPRTVKTCGGSYREVGPYQQTLFLGCSITNFNMSLGWGAEQSTLTVNLVDDKSYHPLANQFGALNSRVTSTNNDRRTSNSFNDPALRSSALELGNPQYYTENSTSNGNINTKYTVSADENSASVDQYKNLHKDITAELAQSATDVDNGKILYKSDGSSSKLWLDPDISFLGLPKKDDQGNIIRDGYDIIGTPVYFKFADGIAMGGYVHGWKAIGGQGGTPLYDVEIRSYASLLSGSWLIIDNYVGSISTIINDDIAVPSLTAGDYTGSIKRGNLPNVFNVYGYLESMGFGTAGKTSNGVSALQIYNALLDLTTGTKNQYSPYGFIVGKHIVKTDGTYCTTDQTIATSSTGTTVNLEDCGICKSVTAIDSINRSLFYLDISEVPAPPNDLYISSATINILQFINDICDGSGYDFYVSFEPSTNANYSGIIKIKTVSKRVQPQKEVIKTIVENLVNQGLKVSNFSYGQEFTDKNVRAMYIGGKQKRLLQVQSIHLAVKQNSMVFDPYSNNGNGSFMPIDSSFANNIRVPNEGSTRYSQFSTDGGSAVGQINTDADFNTQVTFGNSFPIPKGNYYDTETVPTQSIDANPLTRTSYVLYNDLICPYFGTHGHLPTDTTDAVNMSEPRKVFWDQATGQLQIQFRTNDITTILSQPYMSNGEFVVLENEIRAAGSGFEAWFSYCFDNIFNTDIADLVYVAFKRTYGAFANKQNFLAGLGVVNWNSVKKSSATQSQDPRPYAIKMENAQPYMKLLYADLQKIHHFFANIANEYYGKKYMVRTPKMRWYREGDLKITFGNVSLSGSGKIYTDWQVSKDGAWEEYGNVIDDTIVIGSTTADLFTEDDGKIQPILGFNACGELATRDMWAMQNLYPIRNNPFALNSIRFRTSRASAGLGQGEYFYFPLEHSLTPDKYVYIPYQSPAQARAGLSGGNFAGAALGIKTAHGVSVPDNWVYKMYVKSDVEEQIIYIDDQPRVIVTLPDNIAIGGGKNDADDSLFFVTLHDAICRLNPDMSRRPTRPNGAGAGNSIRQNISMNTLLFHWGIAGAGRLVQSSPPSLSINSSAENVSIMKKAACPAFAAIPIQFNLATYGPWINHPGLVGDQIFPGYSNVDNFVNNLVGGSNVEEQDELVPWNYGGMDPLDAAVMNRIRDDIGYQQVTEQGSITVPGVVLTSSDGNAYSMGSILSIAAGATAGPIVSNLTISVSEGGISTTYNMRTYTRKIGFFNKENADRIKQLGMETYKRKKEINNRINEINGSVQNTFAALNSIGSADSPKPLRWSPFEVLAGGAYPQLNQNSSITDAVASLGFGPEWSQKPYSLGTDYNSKDMLRYLTNVAVQDIQELPREFKDDYDRKSFMSLDGILSPISFYPTPYGSTYSITKYPRSGCPSCKGTNSYSYDKLNVRGNALPSTLADIINTKTTTTITPCPFCETQEEKDKRKFISASPKEMFPPYVLASGDDRTIISRNSLNALSGISGNPIINYATLNPILLSSGEFGCVQNRQAGDTTVHSIDLVGFGLSVPEGANSLKPSFGADPIKNFAAYDLNYIDYCASNGTPQMSITPANNMRFFGLRGPLMVHGWGYDLEGYPVPNASGEPKIQNGAIVKDSNNNILYKNQTQKPDGTWTKPYKENSFYKGWGQLPGTWPVGPVDLRWDGAAGVWTVGSNYKPVWIIIETDLIGNQPSRGEIIGDIASNEILPDGLRRLVFVKDTLGINPAPRGAQIYCKYDSKNGFYEPIYNRPYITSGVINGSTTVDIYKVYSTGTTNERYTTTYNNPLSFNVSQGDMGIFTFIGSGWVLQSYRC